jgi:hypothetical protein
VRTTAVFIGDFPFVVVTKDGARAQGTLAQMVRSCLRGTPYTCPFV